MDTADTETRRENRIPVDLNQPLVLGVHNPGGDITVRAAERTDVLISHVATRFSGDRDEEIELIVDVNQNRIEVRGNPHAGTGRAGAAGPGPRPSQARRASVAAMPGPTSPLKSPGECLVESKSTAHPAVFGSRT